MRSQVQDETAAEELQALVDRQAELLNALRQLDYSREDPIFRPSNSSALAIAFDIELIAYVLEGFTKQLYLEYLIDTFLPISLLDSSEWIKISLQLSADTYIGEKALEPIVNKLEPIFINIYNMRTQLTEMLPLNKPFLLKDIYDKLIDEINTVDNDEMRSLIESKIKKFTAVKNVLNTNIIPGAYLLDLNLRVPIIETLQNFDILSEAELISQIKKAYTEYEHWLKRIALEKQLQISIYTLSTALKDSPLPEAKTLIDALNQHQSAYFKNPKRNDNDIKVFQDNCKHAINAVKPALAKQRGWYAINPIIRKILGILAALTVIPAVAVRCFTTQGYYGTFFTTPETDEQKAIKAFAGTTGNAGGQALFFAF